MRQPVTRFKVAVVASGGWRRHLMADADGLLPVEVGDSARLVEGELAVVSHKTFLPTGRAHEPLLAAP
jgi:hypothetical protein